MFRAFEEGVELVGADYLSHRLWDVYIGYKEKNGATFEELLKMCRKILKNPIEQVDQYFEWLLFFTAFEFVFLLLFLLP